MDAAKLAAADTATTAASKANEDKVKLDADKIAKDIASAAAAEALKDATSEETTATAMAVAAAKATVAGEASAVKAKAEADLSTAKADADALSTSTKATKDAADAALAKATDAAGVAKLAAGAAAKAKADADAAVDATPGVEVKAKADVDAATTAANTAQTDLTKATAAYDVAIAAAGAVDKAAMDTVTAAKDIATKADADAKKASVDAAAALKKATDDGDDTVAAKAADDKATADATTAAADLDEAQKDFDKVVADKASVDKAATDKLAATTANTEAIKALADANVAKVDAVALVKAKTDAKAAVDTAKSAADVATAALSKAQAAFDTASAGVVDKGAADTAKAAKDFATKADTDAKKASVDADAALKKATADGDDTAATKAAADKATADATTAAANLAKAQKDVDTASAAVVDQAAVDKAKVSKDAAAKESAELQTTLTNANAAKAAADKAAAPVVDKAKTEAAAAAKTAANTANANKATADTAVSEAEKVAKEAAGKAATAAKLSATTKAAVDALPKLERRPPSAAATVCGTGNMARSVKHSLECQAAIIGYCGSNSGAKDTTCWKLLPNKCPFNRLTPTDPSAALKVKADADAGAATAKKAKEATETTLATAKAAADKSKDAADAAAKTKTDTVTAAASDKALVDAKVAADTAATKAATDKTTADKAKTDADAAATKAATDETAADKAKLDAKAAVDDATADTKAAKDATLVSATTAATKAAADKTAADKAKTDAATAATKAGTDKTAADKAKTDADKAALAVDAAKLAAADTATTVANKADEDKAKADTALATADTAAKEAAAAASAADTAVKTAQAAIDGDGVPRFDINNPSPCSSMACGIGGAKSPRCRGAVIQWCRSKAGQSDPPCWAILSTKNACPFSSESPSSPCRSSACVGISGPSSVECRGVVATFCNDPKGGLVDAACLRIPSGTKGGKATCPFSHDALTSPCFSPDCGAGKNSKACHATVILYCAGPGGNTDPACRGMFYRSKSWGAPTFLEPTPRVSNFHETGFEVEVKTNDPVTGGKWALFENDLRPDSPYTVKLQTVAAGKVSAAAAVAKATADKSRFAATAALAYYNKGVADSVSTNEKAVRLAASTVAAQAELDDVARLGVAREDKAKADAAVVSAKRTAPKPGTAFGTGSYLSGSLSSFAAGVSKTVVTADCKFMPTKTYWVYIEMHHTVTIAAKAPSVAKALTDAAAKAKTDLATATATKEKATADATKATADAATAKKALDDLAVGASAAATKAATDKNVEAMKAEADAKLAETDAKQAETDAKATLATVDTAALPVVDTTKKATIATYSRVSKALRVRSAHDLATLAPTFQKIVNTPAVVAVGWKQTVDNLVGTEFDISYTLREDAVAKGVDLRFSGKNNKQSYVRYPYGQRRRQLRLVDNKVVLMERGRRRTHTNKASAGAVDDYRPDAQWGASLRERAAHAPFTLPITEETKFGMCGAHTYKFKDKVMQSDVYTIDIGYKDFHSHARAGVVLVDKITVDMARPTVAADGIARRSDTNAAVVCADATIEQAKLNTQLCSTVKVTLAPSETGAVHWKVYKTSDPKPTAVGLAQDATATRVEVTDRNTIEVTATGKLYSEDNMMYAIAVDLAGNIGDAITEVPLPKAGTPAIVNALPVALLFAPFKSTKVGAIFDVRLDSETAVMYWFAVEANCATGDTWVEPDTNKQKPGKCATGAAPTAFLPPDVGSDPVSYSNLAWNREIVSPPAELYRIEIKSNSEFTFKTGTPYKVWFATGNPKVNNKALIVPAEGLSFTTLDANADEYAGAIPVPILGDKTTGLRVSVILGSVAQTKLSYVLNKGDGSWKGNLNGMESKDLIPFIDATAIDKRAPYLGSYTLDNSGAGIFPIQFEEMQAKATLWTMFHVPDSAFISIFETNEENKDADITFETDMVIGGYTVCTFGPDEKVTFGSTIAKQLKVLTSAVRVGAVVNADPNAAKADCTRRRRLGAQASVVTPTDGTSRRLSLTAPRRRRLAGAGIKINYKVVLSNARDVSRAQLIFEELKEFEEIAKDPVLMAALIKAFVAEGLVGDDPINNPISVVSGGKPASSHQSTIYTKPSFGKDAKPLAPINPPKPTVPKGGGGGGNTTKPGDTATVHRGGNIIFWSVLGSVFGVFFIGFAVWFFIIRKRETHVKPVRPTGESPLKSKKGKGKKGKQIKEIEMASPEPQQLTPRGGDNEAEFNDLDFKNADAPALDVVVRNNGGVEASIDVVREEGLPGMPPSSSPAASEKREAMIAKAEGNEEVML